MILVTGATGYIGGRLVPELLARGGLYASLWARQREADEARERLAQALEEEGLPESRAAERLEDEALAST